MFKNFKDKVENQLGKRIKSVKFDHCGEYYSRYNGSDKQYPRLSAKFPIIHYAGFAKYELCC